MQEERSTRAKGRARRTRRLTSESAESKSKEQPSKGVAPAALSAPVMAETVEERARREGSAFPSGAQPPSACQLTMRRLVDDDDLDLLDDDGRLDLGDASLYHGRDVELLKRLLVEGALQLLEGEGEVEDAVTREGEEGVSWVPC